MGYVKVRAKVWSIDKPSNIKEVELLADTSVIYTVMPRNFLNSLGIKVIGKRRFRLADNRVVEKNVGIVGIEVQGIKTHTTTIFGDEGIYLLGVVTLEEMGLEVDPVKRELKPLELLLMPIRGDRIIK